MRTTALALMVLLTSGAAGAFSRADFATLVRRATGLAPAVLDSKRVCVCRGGGVLDGYLGIAVNAPEGARTALECVVPRFADDGHELDEAPCTGGGGTVELLGK